MDLNGDKISFLESSENKAEKIIALFLPDSKAKTIVQMIKCAIVGVSNTAVDVAVFNGLLFLTGMSRQGRGVVILMGISFCFAVTNSFIWNKKWTFKDTKQEDKALKRQMITFFLISLGGLAINLSLGHIVVNIIGPQWGIGATLWANIGKISGIFFTIIWDFTGYKLIVFKK